MALIVLLKILPVLFLLLLPKITSSVDFYSIVGEQTPFIIDMCKLNGPKSVIFLYTESTEEMKMTTLMFKWRRALSHEGVASTNLYFSQLHESSYYLNQIVRPYYIAVISNYDAINEFSLATSTFDMSLAVWLVIFIYEEHSFDYCYNPPGNIFHLRFNSEMMVRCGTEGILREWYSIDTNRTEINDVAIWSLERGITQIVPKFLYKRRYNLQGLVMRGVIVKDTLFSIKNRDGELGGIFGRILRELCVTLNFSFDIVSAVEQFGRWNAKKKIWTGAIAELYAGRADISLLGFAITNARLNVVDFTHPIFRTKNFLFIREPEKFGIEWSSYFLTFTYSVWIAMLGLLIAASVLLMFLKLTKSVTDRKIGYLLIDNFLEIWGIFCQQGLADFCNRSSLRIAYFSTFLLVTILWTVYSAALISCLTSVSHVLPFDSLERFVADGTYQLSVARGTAYYDKFANSGDPLALKVMKLMLEEEELPLTETEGFMRICKNRKLAIYTYDEMRKAVSSKIPCKLVRIDTGHVNNFAIILSKHNPFTGVINFQLQKFIENGMMIRLKNTIFKEKSNDMIKYQPVSLISVISLIFFWSIGIILSICILIMEKRIFLRKGKKMSSVHNIPSIKSSKFYMKTKKRIRNIIKDYAKR